MISNSGLMMETSPTSILGVGVIEGLGCSLVVSCLGVGLAPRRSHHPPGAGLCSQKLASDWWLDSCEHSVVSARGMVTYNDAWLSSGEGLESTGLSGL